MEPAEDVGGFGQDLLSSLALPVNVERQVAVEPANEKNLLKEPFISIEEVEPNPVFVADQISSKEHEPVVNLAAAEAVSMKISFTANEDQSATVPEAPQPPPKEESKEVSPVPAASSHFHLWETPHRPDVVRQVEVTTNLQPPNLDTITYLQQEKAPTPTTNAQPSAREVQSFVHNHSTSIVTNDIDFEQYANNLPSGSTNTLPR